MSCSIIWSAGAKESYTAKCRQQCSPGHYDPVPIERKFQVINNLHLKRFPLWCFTHQTGRQMEADCFSGSCPQKKSLGQIILVAIERESPTISVLKKVIDLLRFITLRADARRLLQCYLPAATSTGTLSFGSYRTIVLGPQQSQLRRLPLWCFVQQT